MGVELTACENIGLAHSRFILNLRNLICAPLLPHKSSVDVPSSSLKAERASLICDEKANDIYLIHPKHIYNVRPCVLRRTML